MGAPSKAQKKSSPPDRDDAASISSAVLLQDIDYPEEELPAYTDEPEPAYSDEAGSSSAHIPAVAPAGHQRDYHELADWYQSPPDLVFQTHDLKRKEYRTLFPDYSTNPTTLYNMISEQAAYPPTYMCELNGSHTELRRQDNKETKDTVTDFSISLNLTGCLLNQVSAARPNVLEILPANVRGYRGTRFPCLTPAINIEAENGEDTKAELRSWCERYVADKSAIKCFTLKRKVINLDTAKVTQLMHSCIQETGYRGHLKVSFPIQHETVVVYSPGLINTWRSTTWIRWVFYLSMLWIFSWPILKLCTARYAVVKAVYPYATKGPKDSYADGLERIPTVMDEHTWYRRWEGSIRRAALSRMRCNELSLTVDYRRETEAVERRAQLDRMNGVAPEVTPTPTTGNAYADGALSFLGQGLRLAGEYNGTRSNGNNGVGGWGADTN